MAGRFKVVLIANDDHPIGDWVSEKLAAAGVDYSYHQCYGRADLERYAADADAIWLHSSRSGLAVEENMDIFTRLVAVVRVGSGTDNVDHQACNKRGIVIAHSPDTVTGVTSDHAIAMLFAAARQVARQDRLVRQGVWDRRTPLPAAPLAGASLGLIGCGRIGSAIVKKLSGFEMSVSICDPYLDAATIESLGGTKVDLETLLTQCQFVLVVCPLTEETQGSIGEKEFDMMRDDAVLVNCARGPIVNEKALYQALKTGTIKGAAVDVVADPPLKKDDPLLSLDNLVVTPHMAGMAHDYPDSIFVGPVQAIIDISQGRLPQWIANKDFTGTWKMNRR